MPQSFLNIVIDLSHHNSPVDFVRVRQGGVIGVIHKSTHGMTGHDETHDERRIEADAAGILWGSYHFGTGVQTGAAQAQRFLSRTQPRAGDLLALDFERNEDGNGNPMGPSMTLEQAREFVQVVAHATGAYPLLYGGSYLKELLGGHHDAVLGQCPLWLAQYTANGALPTWPATWLSWTLWQYTGDGVGGQPHTAAGVGGVCERDYFIGSEEQLTENWKHSLNHPDIGVAAPAAERVISADAPHLNALKEVAQGWSASFRMHLQHSNHLLHGVLILDGPKDGQHYEWVATSGRNPWQSADDLWNKGRGPVPPNPDTGLGNHIETVGYHGSVVPYSHRILPEAVTDPVSKVSRSAFRVHFDNGDDGSAGCIALRELQDFEEFDGLMLGLRADGIPTIPLTLEYA